MGTSEMKFSSDHQISQAAVLLPLELQLCTVSLLKSIAAFFRHFMSAQSALLPGQHFSDPYMYQDIST